MLSSDKMSKLMIKYIEKSINEFKQRDRYDFIKIEKPKQLENKGIYNKLNNTWE